MNLFNWKIRLCAALFTLLTVWACSKDSVKQTPDVSDIEVSITLNRFEQALFALDTNRLEAGLAELEAQYPEFSDIYFNYLLGSKNPEVAPAGHVPYVRGFLTFPAIRQLYDTTMLQYAEMPEITRDFNEAFRYFKYYFPEQPTPSVTTYLSEYVIASFIYGENDLAVGLDFFLGADHPYQAYHPANPNFSAYLTRTFNRDHLVAKTLQPLIEDLVGESVGNTMLDQMIHNGKKRYMLDLLLPYAPDTVKLEVTPAQLTWLQENEQNMWSYFLTEDLLFSTDLQKFRKFVEPSPHSPGMPDEAPGRTGNYMGLKIVEAYMRQFPETSIQELINIRDAQRILEESRYKPIR